MHTLKLKIHDKAYKHFIWFLSKFSKDEIEIIREDETYFETQQFLQNELNEMNEGKVNYLSIDDLDSLLEDKIKSHEKNL
ncbi:hypothetical protein [Plebeiibacterium sediminum]|uniref:Uncharacterized protein n=1 Tax=Plebeiibacterium sediminum TaxID=2992112 RepID=A0AAE3SFR6_9BACT|nr:hypothetical protein [Plebeiobacterium sediminum]MCW3787740.1 hypothetical protein [Plebeiobacterium sediminum]